MTVVKRSTKFSRSFIRVLIRFDYWKVKTQYIKWYFILERQFSNSIKQNSTDKVLCGAWNNALWMCVGVTIKIAGFSVIAPDVQWKWLRKEGDWDTCGTTGQNRLTIAEYLRFACSLRDTWILLTWNCRCTPRSSRGNTFPPLPLSGNYIIFAVLYSKY